MASRAAGTYPPVPEPLPHPIVDTHTHLDICTGVRLPLGAGEPAHRIDYNTRCLAWFDRFLKP